MAYTAKEKILISLLRGKMGDSPFLVDANDQLILDSDGNPQIDLNKAVWSDDEYYRVIKSAMIKTFKGKKNSLDLLDDYSSEIILMQGQIDLTMVLALDAVKYVRYKTPGGIEVERPTPNQLLDIAKALKSSLKDLFEEGGDGEIGAQVVVSILRRYDKNLDMMLPSRYQPTPKFPPFFVASKIGYVEVTIGYSFIEDFRALYLKKIEGATENIIATYYTIKDTVFKDTNVVAGHTYTYRLYVQTVNNDMFYIDNPVTYAGQ